MIEIACIEISLLQSPSKTFHAVINPDCAMNEAATAVHECTLAEIGDKPKFSDIAADFLAFVSGAELVIHNAEFDIGFLTAELARLGLPGIESLCTTSCTMEMAQDLYPAQSNSIDALCERLGIDMPPIPPSVMRDAMLVAKIYLALHGSRA